MIKTSKPNCHLPKLPFVCFLKTIFWGLMLLILFGITSCDTTTTPKTGSLSGSAALVNDTGDPSLDPVNYAGIRVILYEQTSLDTTVTNARAVYPSLGFPIDQNSEFDHRSGKQIASTTTSSDGEFSLTKIAYGYYNLVIMREGWGFRYIYGVQIGADSAALPIEELVLYPERFKSGYINENIVLESWRHLVLTDDTVFAPQSELTLGPNAIVRIAASKKLDFLGSMITQATQGNMFMITSNDGVYSQSQLGKSEIEPYYSVNMYPDTVIEGSRIEWGKFTHGAICMSSQMSNSLVISSSSFLSREKGFWATSSAPPAVYGSLFRPLGTANTGLMFYSVLDGQITNNFISDNETGIRCEAESHPTIANNYFSNNGNAMQLFNSSSEASNNTIIGSNTGVRLAGSFSPEIRSNFISANRAILIGLNGYFANSRAVINGNNINASEFYYYVITYNVLDIDAKNNYHFTTSLTSIESKTYHKIDYPESQQSLVGNVVFNPIAMHLISNAGVQP